MTGPYYDRPGLSDLAAWRRAQGLTQQALASRLGVHTATVSHWERGTHRPDARTWRALVALVAKMERKAAKGP